MRTLKWNEKVIWVAAFLEGEGSFSLERSPRITVSNTDRDVMWRLSVLLEVPLLEGGPSAPGLKPRWYLGVGSHKAVSWMMMVYPFMGNRRKEKIKGIVDTWKSRPSRPVKVPPHCHPERKHQAKGLCGSCYDKYRYHEYKLKHGTYIDFSG